jgi:uncharacterized protein DUF3618
VTRGDGGQPRKSAAEIEDEIRRTRAEIGLTLDALASQLEPRQLVGKGIDMITESVRRNELVPTGIGETIHANRLPLALITAGFAWLVASNLATGGVKAEGDASPGEPIPQPNSRSSAWAHQAAGAARSALRSVHDTGGAILERVEPYAEYAGQVKEQARRAGGSLQATFERHPLLIGLVGLISGAAIAALLPATRREQEWVDKAREGLWNKAEEIGHEAAARVRDLAEHTTHIPEG